MTLETDRLTLIPLTARQLELWTADIHALERELDCTYRGDPMEGAFLGIVKGQPQKTKADEKNYRFHSFWLLLRREDRVVLGAADFKAPPDGKGEVEVGYGIGRAHENSGYTTEAVKAMCGWALGQPGVAAVVAETDPENIASHRVLAKCGMRRYARGGPTLWWRLEKSRG